jgi:hypothetical protein
MSLFGKKEETNKEPVTVTTAKSEDNLNAAVQPETKTEETPEEQREKTAIKMMIVYYPDNGQINVENVQNLTRPMAKYIVHSVNETYKNAEIAQASTSMLLNVFAQQQKGKNIWVPGSK